MKLTSVYLFLMLSGLSAFAQAATTATNTQARNAAGFLPLAGTPDKPSSASNVVQSETETDTNRTTTDATINGYVLDDKHKLMPGDVVSFQVLEDRTNAVHLLVTESSELDVPYIGRVSVAGKTCKQLAGELKTQLEKDYYYKATVVIGLDSLSKTVGKVYIFGPVKNPGPIDIPSNENFTAGKAILRAGGFADFANPKKVEIIRKTPTGNKTIMVNLARVLKEGKTDEDVTLKPDDFIIVHERLVNIGL